MTSAKMREPTPIMMSPTKKQNPNFSNLKKYVNCKTRDQPICLFSADADILPIHGPIFPKFFNLVFCFVIKNVMYSVPNIFFKNFENHDL